MSDTNNKEAGAEPERSVTVTEDMEGERLDKALEVLVSGVGVRGRRRMLEDGRVLVDGRPRPKGYRVQAGQVLSVMGVDSGASGRAALQVFPGLRVVGQDTGFMAALFKPSGLDTEALAGRPGPSVEAALSVFWPGRYARLVNRLDRPTSGLVLAALSPEAHAGYRQAEDLGQVDKHYLALVHGRLEKPLVVSRSLDSSRRRLVRVLDEDSGPLRSTRAEPLAHVPDLDATLVEAVIHKGARHQIRVHLAHAGHPIVGDGDYGPASGPRLYLHHYSMDMPGFAARVRPGWDEWDDWLKMIRAEGIEL